MNTIKAVSRLAGGLSLFGEKAGAHGANGKGTLLEKVKKQEQEELQEEDEKLAAEEEAKKRRESEKRKSKEKLLEKEKIEKEKAERKIAAQQNLASKKNEMKNAEQRKLSNNNYIKKPEDTTKTITKYDNHHGSDKQNPNNHQNEITNENEEPDKFLANGNLKTSSSANKESIKLGVTKPKEFVSTNSRRTSRPQTGGVANRIAAFQKGDLYWQKKGKCKQIFYCC